MSLVFLAGELATPATFFFLPFALGSATAAALAFFGVGVDVAAVAFLCVSAVAFMALWRRGRRLDRPDDEQEAVGATRWIGQEALVTQTIPGQTELGLVRLEREDWRAESLTGAPLPVGTPVVVTRVTGTRVIVMPVNSSETWRSQDPTAPPKATPDAGLIALSGLPSTPNSSDTGRPTRSPQGAP